MKRSEAVAEAVAKVKESGLAMSVLRRGDKYCVQMTSWGYRAGWRVAEMIGPGNVQNFDKSAA